MPNLAGDPDPASLSQWSKFLGRLHPVVLHLPIGMFALVVLIEFGKILRKDKEASTLMPVFFAAVSAVVAVIFGFLLYQSGGYAGETVEDHLWWGIGFAVAMIICTVLKAWVEMARGTGNWLYILLLLATGGIMTVASHDGGSITHGEDFLVEEAPNSVRQIVNNWRSEEDQLEMISTETEVPVIPVSEQVVYTQYVHPIFEQKCVRCHKESNDKGKFRMDTYEGLLEGGKEGEGIEPGSAEDSNIIYRIHLPMDDDEHMPPKDKVQLEEHEIAIIEWWIDAGASPDLKVVDAEFPEEIRNAIDQLVPPEVLAAQKAAEEEKAKAEVAQREELASTVSELQKVYPSALNFESQVSSGLTFAAVSMRSTFGDEELAKLEPIVPALVSVDLSATQITDGGLKVLEEGTKIRMLRIPETGISDAAMDTIAGMVNLESLNLYGTSVTKAGVMKLKDLPNLRRIYLWQTEVDEAAAVELRKAMPECEIILGVAVTS